MEGHREMIYRGTKRSLRYLLIPVLIIIFLGVVNAQKLKYRKFDGGNIKVKVPENFTVMTPEDIAQRFPSVRKQIVALTGPQRVTSFNVAVSATQWRKNDYQIAKDFFKSSIVNLFDRVDFIDEGVKEIKNNNFAYFEFTSLIRNPNNQGTERGYNYTMYFITKGKTLVFTFICPYREMDIWKDVASEMMNSIKLSRNL